MMVRNRFSQRVWVLCDTSAMPDMAKQSMKDQCDINFIMGRYLRSGSIDWLAKHEGSYGDIEPLTFHEAMNVVAKAKEMFADLDSSVRKRFKNDPRSFLEFIRDPENLPEMRKLGLALPEPAAPVEPIAARVAELEVDRAARLEMARRAVTEPAGPAP